MPYWIVFFTIAIIQIMASLSYDKPEQAIAGIFIMILSGICYYFEEDIK